MMIRSATVGVYLCLCGAISAIGAEKPNVLLIVCDDLNDYIESLGGYSMRPLLADPEAGQWPGPDEALTTLYKWRTKYDPPRASYSLRSRDWRYTRYENGMEELCHTDVDPYEWNNLADKPEQADRLTDFRQRLQARLPTPGRIPPQPVWQPKNSINPKADAETWKEEYFAKHPEADADKDGKLTWPEYKAYRIEFDPEPAKVSQPAVKK